TAAPAPASNLPSTPKSAAATSQPPAPSVATNSSSSSENDLSDEGESVPSEARTATKPASTSSASSAPKPATTSKPEDVPLVVKGGAAPAVHQKPAAADAPAPEVGMEATGSGGALSNLMNNQQGAFKPVLQTVNISQGVSQGLLMKKV